MMPVYANLFPFFVGLIAGILMGAALVLLRSIYKDK